MAVKLLLIVVVVIAATVDVTSSHPHAVKFANEAELDVEGPRGKTALSDVVKKRVARQSLAEIWFLKKFKKPVDNCSTKSPTTKSPTTKSPPGPRPTTKSGRGVINDGQAHGPPGSPALPGTEGGPPAQPGRTS